MAAHSAVKAWLMTATDTPDSRRADRTFVRAAMRAPLLARDHEGELARRWREHRDEQALHELVTAYVRLVISIAGRFRGYGLPVGDLVQEGNVGLMQAAARFEPSRNVRFSTYARWYIRSSIQDFVLRNFSIVRTGTTAAQKSLFFNLRRARARLESRSGGTGGEVRARIASALNADTRDVEAMELRLSAGDKSLNEPVGEDGTSEWQDFLADESPSPEDLVVAVRERDRRLGWLKNALADLTPRERTIIRARRLREKSLTLAALGERLGISKERVRQIENEVLAKLRAAVARRVGDPGIAGLASPSHP